jgi:hypothetical protein
VKLPSILLWATRRWRLILRPDGERPLLRAIDRSKYKPKDCALKGKR